MPEKIFFWRGDSEILSDCAINACKDEDFTIEENTFDLIAFKNRGYDGTLRIRDQSLTIDISANGGNTFSAICFAILFFLFGFGALNAWYVLSRKPKNYIKKIVRRISNQLQQYPGTTINIEPNQLVDDEDMSGSEYSSSITPPLSPDQVIEVGVCDECGNPIQLRDNFFQCIQCNYLVHSIHLSGSSIDPDTCPRCRAPVF